MMPPSGCSIAGRHDSGPAPPPATPAAPSPVDENFVEKIPGRNSPASPSPRTAPDYRSVRTTHWVTVDIPAGRREIMRNVDASPGLAAVLRREVRGLERRRAALQAELETLRAQLDAAAGGAQFGIAEVVGHFI